MQRIKIGLLAGLALLSGVARGQADGALGYYNDALIFGQTNPLLGSTARMQGIGGAQVSLGGDMSVIGTNPAGLGFYNKSSFSFTPTLNFHTAEADYLGSATSTYRNNFNFGNIGIVFNTNKGDYTNEKFKGSSFAISIQRTNDFNSEVSYQGRNTTSSIADRFVADANDGALGGLAGTAFDQFLIENADGYIFEQGTDGRTYIFPAGDFDGYTSLVGTYGGYFPRQSETIRTSGYQNAINLAWGGNYNDRVYFGAGLSLESLRYSRVRTYKEDLFRDSNDILDPLFYGLTIRDELSVRGSGVNFNGGLIIRPVEFVTVGVNYRSPTYFSLQDESGFVFGTDWNENYSYYDGLDANEDSVFYDLGSFTETSDFTLSQYNLRTPARLNAGATIFLGKLGFITGDAELVDYGSGQLKSNDFDAVPENESINALYRNVVNLRVGSEFRIDKFQIRGGFAYFPDPYLRSDFDRSRRTITAGFGYREQDYFVDVAVTNSSTNNLYSPYFLGADTPIAEIGLSSTSIAATVGFRF